jgi:beta-galactosidase/beta-glucuronidase
MKNIFITFAFAALVCISSGAASARLTLSLDGQWQIAEGGMDAVPTNFSRSVPVPGLVSLALPAFVEPGPAVKDRNALVQKDPRRDAFWYRRTFSIRGSVPAVATLKIGKAMFGTRVILNGKLIGDHPPCFTPGYFDVRSALKPGENELMVRVGADRAALPPGIPDGFDFEKTRYISGIFDSVELILSGTPEIVNLQVAPDLTHQTIHIETQLHNAGKDAEVTVRFTVREAKSGKMSGHLTSAPIFLSAGSKQTVEATVPIANCHLWSPEDPFLYRLEADSGSDSFATRFGMRTFGFDPVTKKALLNGKPYFMRGSNFTIYRFFEDGACGDLPWNPNWVRLLHERVKEMHWNCLRYCIGFPPEQWYQIADEEGILIQDEFPIWYGGKNWSIYCWPNALKSPELAVEYAEWMRERWNHPCLAIWDASNETSSPETSLAIQKVRGLDLSQRPWDNSYGTPRVSGDVFESHPYHFQDPNYKLSNLASANPVPQGNDIPNPGDSPIIINEYGWLWLNRDGTTTTLTTELYKNLLGTNSTTAERRHLYARYLAAETEYWRSHRQAASVMHFTSLGYSRAEGQTSDHWLDVAKLRWEPEFYTYVRDAFAPVGVMIDAWAGEYAAEKQFEFPVVIINDLNQDWKGGLCLRLLKNGRTVQEQKVEASVPAVGKLTLSIPILMPKEPGRCQLEAVLKGAPSNGVRSVREFNVSPEKVAAPPS